MKLSISGDSAVKSLFLSAIVVVSSCTLPIENPETDSVTQTQADNENQIDISLTQTDTDTGSKTDSQTDTDSNSQTDTQIVTDSITQTITDSITSTITETVSGTITQTLTDTMTQTISDTNTQTQVEERYLSIPLTSQITSVQPMTGIVFWTSNNTALSQLDDIVQLEFSYLVYSDIINEQGQYNWDEFDALLNEVAQRGHQLVLRFRYTYPGETKISVPEYIANSNGYNLTYANVEGQNTFLPDWSFELLESFTLAFFDEFATRYDGDARIAMLQVGFGSYSEYHLWDGPLNIGTNFPTKNFQAQFLNNMDETFQTTKWSISIDAASSQYSPFNAQDELLDLQFAVFDDSFMHENHSDSDNEYNRESWLFFGENRYENNMQGGEFNYYSTYDQQNVLTLPNGAWGRDFESFAEQYNLTYIIGNDQFEYQSAQRIKQASQKMGYLFNIDLFEASENKTKVVVSNQGIAPIYYDAFPSVDGVRSIHSLKGLLPNQSREFLIDQGGVSPKFSIESDHLVDGQVIEFSADL